MSNKSETRCPTEKCVKAIEEYGEHYHGVYDSKWHDSVICERCGGKLNDKGEWYHQCSMCKKMLEPGQLVGLFVPHLCKECLESVRESQRQSGSVCRMCRKVYADCCC